LFGNVRDNGDKVESAVEGPGQGFLEKMVEPVVFQLSDI
jgi:hypothetical protein